MVLILERLTFYRARGGDQRTDRRRTTVAVGRRVLCYSSGLIIGLFSDESRLRRIDGGAVSGLQRLTSLDVSCNLLEELDNDALRSLARLRRLNLADNRLRILPASAPSRVSVSRHCFMSRDSVFAVSLSVACRPRCSRRARKPAYYGRTTRKQGSCLKKEIIQGTTPDARRPGRPRTAWVDNIKTWTELPVEESVRMTEDRDKMEKVRPWCGRPTLGSRTAMEQNGP